MLIKDIANEWKFPNQSEFQFSTKSRCCFQASHEQESQIPNRFQLLGTCFNFKKIDWLFYSDLGCPMLPFFSIYAPAQLPLAQKLFLWSDYLARWACGMWVAARYEAGGVLWTLGFAWDELLFVIFININIYIYIYIFVCVVCVYIYTYVLCIYIYIYIYMYCFISDIFVYLEPKVNPSLALQYVFLFSYM